MALSGMKKISLLSTPPHAKKPIDTLITRWDENIIKKAIEKEIARGGQVIILHNRIRSLPMIEQEIEEILSHREERSDPAKKWESQEDWVASQARNDRINTPKIITIHGQLPAEMIEDRIHAFKKGEYDILISTTVIENGVNFLGANTIIISDAEEF